MTLTEHSPNDLLKETDLYKIPKLETEVLATQKSLIY